MADRWTYLRPAGTTRFEHKDRGSVFTGFLAPSSSPEDALSFLEEIRGEYHDATHHCWAYRTGWDDGLESRCSDDGEPSHTAGTPILSTLETREVSDACLVVVRYFGGVKLGTGGLMRAYRTAAAGAVDCAELDRFVMRSEWVITLPYGAQGQLRHQAAGMDIEVEDEDYGTSLVIRALVPKRWESLFSAFLERMNESWKGAVSWKSK